MCPYCTIIWLKSFATCSFGNSFSGTAANFFQLVPGPSCGRLVKLFSNNSKEANHPEAEAFAVALPLGKIRKKLGTFFGFVESQVFDVGVRGSFGCLS